MHDLTSTLAQLRAPAGYAVADAASAVANATSAAITSSTIS